MFPVFENIPANDNGSIDRDVFADGFSCGFCCEKHELMADTQPIRDYLECSYFIIDLLV